MKLMSSTSWSNFQTSYFGNVVCSRTGHVITGHSGCLLVGGKRAEFPLSYRFVNGDLPEVPEAFVVWEWGTAPGELRAAAVDYLSTATVREDGFVGVTCSKEMTQNCMYSERLVFFTFTDRTRKKRTGFYMAELL